MAAGMSRRLSRVEVGLGMQRRARKPLGRRAREIRACHLVCSPVRKQSFIQGISVILKN